MLFSRTLLVNLWIIFDQKLFVALLFWKPVLSRGSVVKNLLASARDTRDVGLIPGSGRSPGGENSNPLQYSCLENSMHRVAWWDTVHGVSKSHTLSTHLYLFFTFILEKDFVSLFFSVNVQSVQSLGRVRLFVTPWTAACQASLSITNSRSLLTSIELVMPSNHHKCYHIFMNYLSCERERLARPHDVHTHQLLVLITAWDTSVVAYLGIPVAGEKKEVYLILLLFFSFVIQLTLWDAIAMWNTENSV